MKKTCFLFSPYLVCNLPRYIVKSVQYSAANWNECDKCNLWPFEQSFEVIVCNFYFFLAQQGWNILQSALQLFIVYLCFEQDQGSNNKEKNELALVQKFVYLEVMLCVEDPLFHF